MKATDFQPLSCLLTDQAQIITDFAQHQDYLCDASVARGTALALVMAASEEDVVATINFCRENDLPVVPRGAGTGLSGGCVPDGNSVVLSTEQLNHIVINQTSRTAICGPGAITKDLLDTANCLGLTYPPDPASYAESTLGGNVAEGAGGLRCKRFGVTKDYVIGLRGVTASGDILGCGSLGENHTFGLGDVLIGSEGTLLTLTEIEVRLIPQTPDGITILATFGSAGDAARAVSEITGSGLIPNVLEFLDGDAALCSNEYEHAEGFDADIAAIVLIETSDTDKSGQASKIEEICRRNRSIYFKTATDQKEADRLWKIRRNLSKAVKEMAKVRISEDVAVPISRFPDLVEYVAQANESSSLRINAFGHAGDGNLHVNYMSASGSKEDLDKIEIEIDRLLKKAISFGGTLTGEHGIGTAKMKYLHYEFDKPTLDAMLKIKDVLDPSAILNPGKLFERS